MADKGQRAMITWSFGGRRVMAVEQHGTACHFKKLNRGYLPPSRPTPSPHTLMSVNQRGRIVAQVVHPGVAVAERKQKRLSNAHPHPPVPQDIIEISSDEDEVLRPPSKRPHTKRGHPPSTHEPDYKARLSQKDREIEKLKEVRHR